MILYFCNFQLIFRTRRERAVEARGESPANTGSKFDYAIHVLRNLWTSSNGRTTLDSYTGQNNEFGKNAGLLFKHKFE